MLQILMLIATVLLVAFDQITKGWALTLLKPVSPYVLWDGVFELYYTENTGAAFGIFDNQRWILLGVTTVALLALLYVMMTGKLGRHWLVTVTSTLILAGGVGNLIDRIFRGYVVDFFYFKLINFAIFNVADCFVVVGATLLLVYFLFVYREGHPQLGHAKETADAAREEVVPDGASDIDAPAGEDGLAD